MSDRWNPQITNTWERIQRHLNPSEIIEMILNGPSEWKNAFGKAKSDLSPDKSAHHETRRSRICTTATHCDLKYKIIDGEVENTTVISTLVKLPASTCLLCLPNDYPFHENIAIPISNNRLQLVIPHPTSYDRSFNNGCIRLSDRGITESPVIPEFKGGIAFSKIHNTESRDQFNLQLLSPGEIHSENQYIFP